MIRITPIAVSNPLITLEGKKAAMKPAREIPRPICSNPPITTAVKKASKEPSWAICMATIAVKPAAGPETLECEPLNAPITKPPTIPASNPENSGAPDAKAIPKQSGSATKNTTRPDTRSRNQTCGENRFTSLLLVCIRPPCQSEKPIAVDAQSDRSVPQTARSYA